MNRREEADSGLRAGFVHEDELKEMTPKMPPLRDSGGANKKEEDKKDVMEEQKVAQEKMEEDEGLSGPQVAVQGVSGRMIKGVIKAVKRRKPEEDVQEQASKAGREATQDLTSLKEKEAEQRQAASALSQKEPDVQTVFAKPEEMGPVGKAELVEKVEVKQAKEMTSSRPKKSEDLSQQEQAAKEPLGEPPKEPAVKADLPQDRKLVSESERSQRKAPAAQAPVVGGKKATTMGQKTRQVAEKETASAVKSKETKKAPTSGSEKKESRVKSDQGVIITAQERMARAGKTPIRPQSGSYVGRDRNKPAYAEEKRTPRAGKPGPRPPQETRSSSQRRPGRQDSFMDKDKDEEETPRRSRSPRPKKKTEGLPDETVINVQKEVNRKSFKNKNQRDQERRTSSWRSREEIEFDQEAVRRARRRKARTESQTAPVKTELTQVSLPSVMTVKEFAEIIKKTSADVIRKLMEFGVMATLNQEIDFDTAAIIANELGIKAEQKVEITEEDILFDDSDDLEEDLEARPPVVVVMGHVDHGKTSILDWIRSSRVAAREAGGITQHIGAYMVDVHGKQITFLDTPGHEAFTTIRARGAQVTDIAVLVVAADDGVMPQTIEAINHARAAETEIIVAINKIDKPGANLDKVKQELAAQNILGSDWGGDTTIVPVSAKTGENMEELLEMILLTAEVMELKANPNRQAKGTVIEASLDKNRGPIATLLVQRGTLQQGDALVVGTMMGNIRAMFDDRGGIIEEAGPSVPVEIMGLPEVPEAGDIFYEVENEKVARSLVARRQEEERELELSRTNKLSLENLFEQMGQGETKDLNIIVKADVQGSVQAMSSSLEKLSNEEVRVHIIHGAVGAVNASDIRLADVSNAIIIGFNVRPPSSIIDLAKENNVEIRLYRVIYEAIEDVENAMKGMLDPVFEEEVLGNAEIREIYKVSGVGTIAGCYVTSGLMRRSAEARVVRDGIVIHEGRFASLRRFQDDVREVQHGYECGLSIDRFNNLRIGDTIECFYMKEVERA